LVGRPVFSRLIRLAWAAAGLGGPTGHRSEAQVLRKRLHDLDPIIAVTVVLVIAAVVALILAIFAAPGAS
jgi:hypothetical protein